MNPPTTRRLIQKLTRLTLGLVVLAAAAFVRGGVAAPFEEARAQAATALRAAGRGNPWLNLTDGKALPGIYTGPQAMVDLLSARARSSRGTWRRPISTATACQTWRPAMRRLLTRGAAWERAF